MECFKTEQIFAFAQGRMSGEQALTVEEHLDLCALCRALLAEATRTEKAETQLSGSPQSGAGAASLQLQRGTMLGRYVVLERVGAGGMGVVHAADDPELDRRVALKLIRIDSVGPARQEQAEARLLREAQATARVIHPNVITIHDVGRIGGHVFLAMEFVEGTTLRVHLQEARRDWREVLGLFLQAGRGLAAAHAKGLVHRDFKPDNVLVGRDGRVRITDFGLARIVHDMGDSPEQSPMPDPAGLRGESLTRSDTVLGTPAYMAPEQRRGEASDARSDQFSYCVALYEALYGERPFAGGTPTGGEGPKQLTELRPPRDSAVPSWVQRAIVQGLSASPELRHASMDELLRLLSGSPRSRWQRAGVAAGVGLLLVAGGAALHRSVSRDPCLGSEQALVGIWDAPRKSALQGVFGASPLLFAADAWREVEQTLDAYSRDWVGAHQEACIATRVRGHQTEGILERRVVCLDQRLKELSAVVDMLASGEAQVIENAARAVHGLDSLAPCADISTLASPEPPAADAETQRRLEGIRTRFATVRAKLNAGQVLPSLELATVLAQEARDAGYRPLEAQVLGLLAEAQGQAGRYRDAIKTRHRAVQVAESSREDRQAAESWVGLVRLMSFVKAEMDPDEEYPLHAAAAVKRLGGDPRLEARLASNLVSLHRARGRTEEALTESQRALAMARKSYTDEEPELATALLSAGQMLGMRGQYEEGIPLLREAESIYRKTYGPEHPNLAVVLDSIAVHEVQAGHPERALEYGQRALAIYQRVLGDAHPGTSGSFHNIGGFLLELGRAAESLEAFERATRLREKHLGAQDPKLAASLSGMGRALSKLGRYAEAAEQHQRALAIREQALGPDNSQLAHDLLGLGNGFQGMNAPLRARSPLERALAILERQPAGTMEGRLAEVRFALARVLAAEPRELARARKLAGGAAEYLRKVPARAAELQEVERWLAVNATAKADAH
jgi:tetratricopeptide (TPR) repeat protein